MTISVSDCRAEPSGGIRAVARSSRTLYDVGYIDDDTSEDAPVGVFPATTAVPASPEDAGTDQAPVAAAQDEFLLSLLPQDTNSRQRVVAALLRAILAERKIT